MLNDLAVVGAAGKMGQGISYVLLQLIALGKINPTSVQLVDTDPSSLLHLRYFLKDHLRKFAEKNINFLRMEAASNPKLVSNEEIIEECLERAVIPLRLSLEVQPCEVVFEAIFEDEKAKKDLFKNLKCLVILSNTSSIPVHRLQEGVETPVVGFHFYNPPQVQKLVELAFANDFFRKEAFELVKLMNKIGVESKDVPGFIGNGFLFKEIEYACQLVEELSQKMPFSEAIALVNRITGDFILRPMGIFELIDYIGYPVCQSIASIMSLDPFKKVKGPFSHYIKVANGALWKEYKGQKEKIALYLQDLKKNSDFEATLAKNFLAESNKIGKQLVQEGVVKSINDLNTVLIEGFHHLYGVIDEKT